MGTLSTETQGLIALEFDMSSNEPFSVQLEWPMWRFYRRVKDSGGCEVDPQFTVLVAKKESPAQYKLLQKGVFYANWISNARATLQGGSGKYVIYVDVKFPKAKSWLKEFVVNIYGPPTTLQVSKTAPADLLQAMGYQNQNGYLQKSAKMEAEVDVDDDENLEKSCAHALDRLAKLNNGPEIARLGTDPMFPENWKSLTERKGLKCGDTATGAPAVGCEQYDNWGSFKFANECNTIPSGTSSSGCTCSKSGMGKGSWKSGGKTVYTCGRDQECQRYGIRCPPGSGGPQPTPATPAPRPEPPAATPAPRPEPPAATPAPAPPAGNGEIVLGSSTKDEKCVTMPEQNMDCEYIVEPTGDFISKYQWGDQLCLAIPGGWTEEVRVRCTRSKYNGFW